MFANSISSSSGQRLRRKPAANVLSRAANHRLVRPNDKQRRILLDERYRLVDIAHVQHHTFVIVLASVQYLADCCYNLWRLRRVSTHCDGKIRTPNQDGVYAFNTYDGFYSVHGCWILNHCDHCRRSVGILDMIPHAFCSVSASPRRAGIASVTGCIATRSHDALRLFGGGNMWNNYSRKAHVQDGKDSRWTSVRDANQRRDAASMGCKC